MTFQMKLCYVPQHSDYERVLQNKKGKTLPKFANDKCPFYDHFLKVLWTEIVHVSVGNVHKYKAQIFSTPMTQLLIQQVTSCT
jgi:hypothetical protein